MRWVLDWIVCDLLACVLILRHTDHVKTFLENNQQEALKQYTTVVHALRKINSITPHLTKSASSSSINIRPTYLCIQCANVATPEQRDKHDKAHVLCKIRTMLGGRP